jgi:DNA-binding CsgD family transcriptional regulator
MVKNNIRTLTVLDKLHEQESKFKRELAKTFLDYLETLPTNKRIEQVESVLYGTNNNNLPTLDRRLTPQEKKCLLLASKGKETKEMANILGLSQRTVKYHRANITKKLDVPNLIAAVAAKNQCCNTNNDRFYELERIIKNLPNYIFVKDTNFVYMLCNHNFDLLAGESSPVGKNDYELPWDKSSARLYQEEDQYILNTGNSILNKEVPMFVSKEKRYLSVSKVPLYDEQQCIIGILGTCSNIIEKKEESIIFDEASIIDASYVRLEFIKNLSIDLKTLVLGIASLLQPNGHLDQQKQKYFAKLIDDAVAKLIELINSLMDLDGTEYQKAQIKKEKKDLLEFSKKLKTLIPSIKLK